MELHPTPAQQALIRQAIDSGRYKSEEDAARDALALWEENERGRGELLAALDEGEADLAAGRFTEHAESTTLARELKQEAREVRRRG
ncbi:MAG: type II toxin-antitoxin system ParD family antitoxin [Vicinamibacterales bacterium]